ncbi:hypothetical protein QBC35DRAFT_533202 [Podospora australis]|uniref:Uncharacterized protein n=1 Tax=Podospora australis TaxID=1536484 RepID=A0AAN6WSC9_9PEZI|nr:hypothetical protein QBC35DRAFT_533202 [Podospora australis]
MPAHSLSKLSALGIANSPLFLQPHIATRTKEEVGRSPYDKKARLALMRNSPFICSVVGGPRLLYQIGAHDLRFDLSVTAPIILDCVWLKDTTKLARPSRNWNLRMPESKRGLPNGWSRGFTAPTHRTNFFHREDYCWTCEIFSEVSLGATSVRAVDRQEPGTAPILTRGEEQIFVWRVGIDVVHYILRDIAASRYGFTYSLNAHAGEQISFLIVIVIVFDSVIRKYGASTETASGSRPRKVFPLLAAGESSGGWPEQEVEAGKWPQKGYSDMLIAGNFHLSLVLQEALRLDLAGGGKEVLVPKACCEGAYTQKSLNGGEGRGRGKVGRNLGVCFSPWKKEGSKPRVARLYWINQQPPLHASLMSNRTATGRAGKHVDRRGGASWRMSRGVESDSTFLWRQGMLDTLGNK